MKDKRQRTPWQTGLTVFTAVLGLLLALLLGGCSANEPEITPSGSEISAPAETLPPVTDAPTTAPTTEATTAPTEAPTEAPTTEPTTQPTTEPTTAPTEPATEPTSGGNSTPGGTSGYYPGGSGNSGSTEETKPVEEFVPAQPGTPENPYMEDLSTPPREITSVFVPASGQISYEAYALDKLIVTVQDPEAYIIHKDVTYLPDEDGILAVTLTPAVPEAPEADGETAMEEEEAPEEEQPEEEPQVREWFVMLPFTLGSKAETEKAFTLSFTETEGGATNPQIIGSVDVITTVLEENDRNGYHYLWTAAEDDTITFSVESVTPETAVADVFITKGETTLSLRADGVENENKVIELPVDVLAEEQLLIQVITAEDEAGNYPAAAIVLLGKSAHAEGTETNPVKVALTQIPFELTTVTVPAGQGNEIWYEITGAGGCILTVADADGYIHYGDAVFTPDENGIITVELAAAAGRVPVVLQIGNSGMEEKTFQMSFAYPEGGMMAPVEITDLSMIQAVTGTDGTVCYSWTATGTGVVQIAVPDSPETAAYDVEVNNITLGSYKTLAADAATGDTGTYILNYVRQGDTLQILVSAKDASAGLEVTLEGYVLGNEEAPLFVSGEQLNLPVAGGEEVTLNAYCYEHTMTISSSNAYIIFGDQRFEPVDGTVSVTFPVNTQTMGRPTPLAIVVGNSSEAVQTYEIRIEAPVGSAMNPQKIESFSEVNVSIPQGDSDGAWVYSWTAEQTGILHVSVYNETEGVEYEISIYNPATGAYMNLSEDGVRGDLGTYVQTYVRQGDTVEITVSAAGQMGSDFVMVYPALDLTLSGYMVGTADSPMFLGETSFVIPLAAKSQIPVMGYCYTQTMTVTGENVYVVYDGNRYEPVEGVITLTFPENPVMVGRPEPIQFVIGNDNDFALKLPVLMEFPLGSRSNPEELTQLQPVSVSLEAENPEGYYYKWTAPAEGTLSFRITGVTEKLQGDIVLTNENTGAQRNLAGEQADAVSVPVAAGDVILIQLVAVPDEKDWSYPAIEIAAMGEFTAKE